MSPCSLLPWSSWFKKQWPQQPSRHPANHRRLPSFPSAGRRCGGLWRGPSGSAAARGRTPGDQQGPFGRDLQLQARLPPAGLYSDQSGQHVGNLHLTRGEWLIPIITKGDWLIHTPYKMWLIDSYTLQEVIDWFLYTLERWLIDYYTLREVIDWFLHLTRGEWLIHIPYKRWSIDSYPRGDWLISTPYEMWLIDYYTLRELIDCFLHLTERWLIDYYSTYKRWLIDSYTPYQRWMIDSWLYTLQEVIDWFLYTLWEVIDLFLHLERGGWLIPIPYERWLIDSYILQKVIDWFLHLTRVDWLIPIHQREVFDRICKYILMIHIQRKVCILFTL